MRPKRCMGRTDVPDLSTDYERAYGWKGKPSTRAKWRSGSSARRSVVENSLTPPTLSERRFCNNNPFETLPTERPSLTCQFRRRKIRASDRTDHLALPHRREVGRRGHG